MAEEFDDCLVALKQASQLIEGKDNDIRILFCSCKYSKHFIIFEIFHEYSLALVAEKRKDYDIAFDGYMKCLQQCTIASKVLEETKTNGGTESEKVNHIWEPSSMKSLSFFKQMRGEIMLRVAIVKKEINELDASMLMCTNIIEDNYGDAIKANALCLKGLLHEMTNDFPSSEVSYRAALQIIPGHSIGLERLGRVYLRYRETIPAAVQCFFKSVETNPSNHVAWYLLGRCYMATAQYNDACEAYNRAVNLNPNDPQIWCSLGK